MATLDAYPDWQIPARVIMPVPTADRQKATVRVRLGFEQLDPRILPDMGVKVAFLGEDDDRATDAAPRRAKPLVRDPHGAAVRKDGDRDVVFVVAGERAERRAVGVAPAPATRRWSPPALAAGERVVIEGAGGPQGRRVHRRSRTEEMTTA